MVEERRKPFSCVRHETIKSCLEAHWQPCGLTLDELQNDCEGVGVDENGEEVRFTLDQELDGIKAAGVWGWADTTNRVIHYWHDGKRTADELAFFLAHEIAHLYAPVGMEPLAEEAWCDACADVAVAMLSTLGMVRGEPAHA